jgi:hypothetical protein
MTEPLIKECSIARRGALLAPNGYLEAYVSWLGLDPVLRSAVYGKRLLGCGS